MITRFVDMLSSSMREQMLQKIRKLVQEASLRHGQFRLSSGEPSNYYVDGKKFTLNPEGAYLIGKEIFERLSGQNIEAVGGLSIGADPIATAVALVSYLEGEPIPAFIVRVKRKEHGTQGKIEGHLPSRGGRVAIVDDVMTKGMSVMNAIEAVEAEGCQVVKVVVLLDRHGGGSEKLRERGYDFSSILSSNDAGEITIDQP